MGHNKVGVFFANVVGILISFLIAYLMRFGWTQADDSYIMPDNNLVLFSLLASYAVVFLFYRPAEVEAGRRGFLHRLKYTVITNILMAAAFSVYAYTSRASSVIPRSFVAYFFVINCISTFIIATIFNIIGRAYTKRHLKRTIVFTDGDMDTACRRLMKSGQSDFKIVGVVKIGRGSTDDALYNLHITRKRRPKTSYSLKTERNHVLPEIVTTIDDEDRYDFDLETDDVQTYLKRHNIDQIILCVGSIDRTRIRRIIDLVGNMGIDAMITTDSLAIEDYDSRLEDFGTMEVIRYAPRLFSTTELFIKRVIDIIGAIVGCILTIIIGIFVAPAIFIEDPGPVIFKQKRVGKNGRYFYIYKFRSMYQDAEDRLKDLMDQNEMQGQMFKIKNDPRITKVGKFIRKTSLDEFPQFFNVLKGDMSLVGTRPPTVAEYEHYSAHHKRRLSIKPGITGMWQVSGRSEITDFEEVVRLDCYYIDHWSVLFDIKILCQTIAAVFSGKGSE